MYSNKGNINILTALLKAHSVQCAVVCPGSRNAAIVHNLLEAGLECHRVTDERSAAFYALGLALAKRQPVAVCVTSGSALLNTLPAVAEAYYRHVPLAVISGDRPAWAIGQLQGQTLPQPGALEPYAVCSVDIPEVSDATSASYCQRLVNEALCEMTRHHGNPVHINVPISEPLFQFNTPALPEEQKITVFESVEYPLANSLIEGCIQHAQRPIAVLGQCAAYSVSKELIARLGEAIPVLYEPLSADGDSGFVDSVISAIGDDERYAPDLIFYLGDTLVSNRLKKYLSSVPDARTVAVNLDGKIHDVFGNLSYVVDDSIEHFLQSLCDVSEQCSNDAYRAYRDLWRKAIAQERESWNASAPAYKERYVVHAFENLISGEGESAVHYANSSVVRYATLHADHYVYVNRGVNGIEGSLSTAAGFSLGTDKKTYCVIGDLSFFYDCNALWNAELRSNLRILLINNGFGKIFNTLPGLKSSEAYPDFVAGTHHATAKGICESFGINYRSVDDLDHFDEALDWLAHADASRPLLLECIF